jgi:hypothetical protein
VIHESSYWKEPLLVAADFLEELQLSYEESEDELAKAEREILIGFYTIRKLLDTFKVSEETKRLKFDIKSFQPIQEKQVDYFNRWEVEDVFNLDRTLSETRDILYLCNQFVHSYVLVFEINRLGQIDGVFVSSDRAKTRRLYCIDRQEIVGLFRRVGEDYPSAQAYCRDDETGQWKVVDKET